MTVLTISASDWDILGLRPASDFTYVWWKPVSIFPNPVTGRVESTARVETKLNSSGATTVELPPPAPGKGIWLDTGITGFKETYFSQYPDTTVTLVDLLKSYQVDPDTLERSTSGQAAWDLTLAQIQAIQQEIAENTVTATIDPDDEDVLLLRFPTFQTDPDDDLVLVLPIGA